MADIVLNVEVRERTGTGGAREARSAGKVPGVLYGGELDPVPIAVSENAFKKALYTGKLLGHLVTLKYGDETQPVIAKEVQFHPVTDRPIHFDLYRVDAHQEIKIAVAVHFRNEDASPGLKRGGALNVALHEVELMVPADQIPEELVVRSDRNGHRPERPHLRPDAAQGRQGRRQPRRRRRLGRGRLGPAVGRSRRRSGRGRSVRRLIAAAPGERRTC